MENFVIPDRNLLKCSLAEIGKSVQDYQNLAKKLPVSALNCLN